MLDARTTNRIVMYSKIQLGLRYSMGFNCLTFARSVYAKVELSLPPLHLNLSLEDLQDPPVGYLLYLKHKTYTGTRTFTHVAIVLPERNCIHCSFFFGMGVVITPIDELLEVYDLA